MPRGRLRFGAPGGGDRLRRVPLRRLAKPHLECDCRYIFQTTKRDNLGILGQLIRVVIEKSRKNRPKMLQDLGFVLRTL